MKGQGAGGIFLQEGPEHGWQQIGADTAHGPHPQGPAPVPPGQIPGLLPHLPPLLRHLDEVLPLFRQLQPALAPPADQQDAAQLLLQGPDVTAHRRLGDIEPLGRAGETAGLHGGQKYLDLLMCHDLHS